MRYLLSPTRDLGSDMLLQGTGTPLNAVHVFSYSVNVHELENSEDHGLGTFWQSLLFLLGNSFTDLS